MAGKNTAVFGIYARQEDFEKGLYQLKEAGFRHEDISVLVPENLGTEGDRHRKGHQSSRRSYRGCELGSGDRRGAGVAGRDRHTSHTGRGAAARSGSDCCRLSRSGSGRSRRWIYRCPDRHGDSGIRSEALRRAHSQRRHSAVGPL